LQQSDIETAFADLLERAGCKPPSPFDRGTRLDALGLDSLSKIDVAVAAEDRFGVAIPDEDLERFVTVGDLMDHVRRASS